MFGGDMAGAEKVVFKFGVIEQVAAWAGQKKNIPRYVTDAVFKDLLGGKSGRLGGVARRFSKRRGTQS